ncbi:MAG: glycosyltransferase family 2 protein [bacterium]|nr:glycosyltransferase family 2 protein [bacterium]
MSDSSVIASNLDVTGNSAVTGNSTVVGRLPVSAFVIAFNEEEHIVGCIQSLSFCDEVIVIDSFSTDRTVELAREAGARVVQQKWTGYRAQKEYGLSLVTHDWVINLDADERISAELRQGILRVLEEKAAKTVTNFDDECIGYYINRVVYYLGRWWRSGGWYPEYRLRFFRRDAVRWGGVDPHEKPLTDGRTERLAGEIEHYTYKDMHDQFRRLDNFSSIAAREEFGRGKRSGLVKITFNPLLRFAKFYLFKRGYREGFPGLLVALNEAVYTYMKYAKLWDEEFRSCRSAGTAGREVGNQER